MAEHKLMPPTPTAAMLEAGEAAYLAQLKCDEANETLGKRFYIGGPMQRLMVAYRAMQAVAPGVLGTSTTEEKNHG